jgi:hypothetical protein
MDRLPCTNQQAISRPRPPAPRRCLPPRAAPVYWLVTIQRNFEISYLLSPQAFDPYFSPHRADLFANSLAGSQREYKIVLVKSLGSAVMD